MIWYGFIPGRLLCCATALCKFGSAKRHSAGTLIHDRKGTNPAAMVNAMVAVVLPGS
jgi:hypothetical protein